MGTIGDGGATGNLGKASNAAANLVFNGGTLQYTGVTASTNRNFTINAGKTATFEITTAASTLTVSGASTATTGALTKTGAGTLKLTGTNLHSGATTVNDGKLIIDGSVSTSIVNIGGTLGGTGSVGTLTVASGGTLAPGSSTAILDAGNTNLQAGSFFDIELNNTTVDTGYDQLNVTGTVTLAGALNVTMGFTPINGDLFFILANDGTLDAITGTFSNAPTNGDTYTLGGQQFQISYFGDTGGNTFTGGNDVVLMAIPEPNVAALFGGLGALMLLRRRRA